MSKKSQSGLATLKRDFSQTSLSSQSSQPISWSPSPLPPPKPLSSREQRLKDIQDALAGNPVKTERVLTNSSNQVINKRPADGMALHPPVKKRAFPGTWTEGRSPSEYPTASSSRHTPAPQPITVSKVSTTTAKVASVFLSKEQTKILELVKEGHCVFYTGSAGTGKSVLLREIIKTMRRKFVSSSDAVAITASTGIAACNIGGVTIHSFSGIGLGIESAEDLVKKIKKNKKAAARWLRTKVLIIDEVSMVDGDLFDKLARIGSILRKNPEPFGGIQVIVTGDFFQLPPVTKGSATVKFAFEAQLWTETIKRSYNLTKVFRQSDQEFVAMLNEMRFGRLTDKSIAKFKALSRDVVYEDGLGATELFPRREDVDRSNFTRISHLSTDEKRFGAKDSGTITDPAQRSKMLANFMAPELLTLRVDAQVMLIKNVDENLVNGSMGRVVRFVDPAVYGSEMDIDGGKGAGGRSGGDVKGGKAASGVHICPVVEFVVGKGKLKETLVMPETWKVELPNGEVQASRTQLPLILAWAMSIHKSQGQTLERVKVDLGKVFEKGQAYVALSRATSLDGLQVLNFDPNKVKAHPKVTEWSKTLETISLD